ncbi:N-acetylglucosamine-6-phosphate deacetylase [Glaciimonas soli]|uniref:Amidohydrolase family protein n=1 Tax=Glaciimonas soli TaxID=2590999 RepID=A0A843YX69_9BURK|nr:amidohydrolase family protein [Glaciimonas soli]MQR02068.1 amidohydrolase family protein [Glaciimonas soli]
MNSSILTGKDPASGRSLEVEYRNGLICAIRPGPVQETAWLCPGLIDLQVNGYLGHDLNTKQVTVDTVAALATALQATGVSTFLPTLITASEAQIISTLRVIATARRQDSLLERMIPYVHVEGPALSAEAGPRGAHPSEQIRPPSLAEFERWQAASNGLVGMVTISPHWPKSAAYIAALSARGVSVAIGHTHASGTQITMAADAGARLSTHLGNGAHGTLPRHPNYLWAQLAEDRLYASFIADGHHLPADTLKTMLRAKGIERSILVSDTAALGGMPPGDYESPIGGKVHLAENGRLNVAGTQYLAGATAPLIAGVAHVTGKIGLSLAQALQMATANPGKFVTGRGVLAVGTSADLLRFHWTGAGDTLVVETVVIAGCTVLGKP